MDVVAVIISVVTFFLVLGARSWAKAALESVARLESRLWTLENRGAVEARQAADAKPKSAPGQRATARNDIDRPDYATTEKPTVMHKVRCPFCDFINPPGRPSCARCGKVRERGGKSVHDVQPVAAGMDSKGGETSGASAPEPVDVGAVTADSPSEAGGPVKPPIGEVLVDRLKSTEEWEALIGGRWMNRVGAVALILGMGFFLKYAFDSNWISQSLRVAIGVVVGLGLLAGARHFHGKGLQIFSQGLVGAGIATLYLSTYASFQFYHLVPEPVALVGMACVTTIGFVEALYYDSLAVGVLSWLGGFITIPLLGISRGTEMGMIGYLLLLEAGILAIVFAKDRWSILEPLTMGAIYATYFSWYGSSYDGGSLGLALFALSAFWALFYALDVSRIVLNRRSHAKLRHWLGALNVTLYYTGIVILLNDHRTWLGIATLAIGAVYIATILVTRRRLQGSDRVDARYALTAIVLMVVATPILATGLAIPIAWSLEALVLIAIGLRSNLWFVWGPTVVVFVLATLDLLVTPGALAYDPLHSFRILFNERALAFLVVAASLGAGAVLVRRSRFAPGARSSELGSATEGRATEVPRETAVKGGLMAKVEAGLHFGWISITFTLLTVETNDHFRQLLLGASHLTLLHLEFLRPLILATVWMVFSLMLVWYGLRTRIFPILSSGFLGTALSIGFGAGFGAYYQPIEQFVLVLNIRVLILTLLTCALVVQYGWLRRERKKLPWLETVILGVQAAMGLIVFEILTVEVHDFFRHQSGALSERAGQSGMFVELMILAAVWMLYSFPLVRYGIRHKWMPVLLLGLASIGGSVTVGAIAAVAFEPTHWLSTALGLRPVILLAVMAGLFVQMSVLRREQGLYPWFDVILIALQAATVLLGFELVSGETWNWFGHEISTAKSGSSADQWRNLEQLSLSLIWMLYAIVLMGFGLWKRTRWLRLASMLLLGLIILKIFAYDLAFLSPAYRSVSFVVLGVILLGVSYVYQRYRGRLEVVGL